MLKKTTTIAITMFAVLVFTGICGTGFADDNESETFELRARVMDIDLTYNQIVIAEEEMTLLSHFENNKTVWGTRFLDAEGRQISPDTIESGSRVLVRGEIENEVSIVEEIILLE